MSNLYDVALSFAGEDRPYVRQVAEFLRTAGVRVFYDEFEQAGLWGKDLTETLDRIYRKDSDLVVMFISLAYSTKVWTRHERRSALAGALSAKSEYVLPARFDDTELDGLPPSIAYLDLRRIESGQLGRMLMEKMAHSGKKFGGGIPSASVPAIKVWKISRNLDLTGAGARLIEGRWHHRGEPIVYASGSLCGALMEVFGHFWRGKPAHPELVSYSLYIDSDVSRKSIYSDLLPVGWQTRQETRLRDIGTNWLRSMETCILSVPSAINPEERTYLLNPSHPDFVRIRVGEPQQLSVDPMLSDE